VGLHRPDPALCIGIQVRAARRQHQRFDARPDAMIARKNWLYLLSRSCRIERAASAKFDRGELEPDGSTVLVRAADLV
jgi:hypothetical protein